MNIENIENELGAVDNDIADRLANIEAIKGKKYRQLLELNMLLGSGFQAILHILALGDENDMPMEIRAMLVKEISCKIHISAVKHMSTAYNDGEELTKEALSEMLRDAERITKNASERISRIVKAA